MPLIELPKAIMRYEKTPSNRLITQNMLTSASRFERTRSVDWASIQDLSAFIDLFCLYDSAAVLGRGGVSIPNGSSSDLLAAVEDARFITIKNLDSNEADEVALVAGRHLATFLEVGETSRFDQLLRVGLSPSGLFDLTDIPDSEHEIRLGREWLLTTPTPTELLSQLKREPDITRGALFLSRSFLYLAHAELSKIAFTPDAVRTPVIDAVMHEEERVRGQLLTRLQSAWEAHTPGDAELLTRVSPLGAYVFVQAAPDKRRIVSTMVRLRQELAEMRRRLHGIEDRLFWQSRDDAIKAQREWNGLLLELERNYGPESQLVTLKRGLSLGEGIGEIFTDPTNPKSWIGALLNLPVEVVGRLLSRRPVVELHRLRPQLPGSERLADAIRNLFDPD